MTVKCRSFLSNRLNRRQTSLARYFTVEGFEVLISEGVPVLNWVRPEMLSHFGMFMFFYTLVEVAARINDIICITQITCKFVYNILLVN